MKKITLTIYPEDYEWMKDQGYSASLLLRKKINELRREKS